MKILVTIDNFWVGGRETYIAEYLRSVRGISATLLASNVEGKPSETSVFERVVEVGGDRGRRNHATWFASWLRKAQEVCEAGPPDLIWAHHFDLLPAWVFSGSARLPLLATFHGPLTGADRPNDMIQSLGMTLAVCRGEGVSGVSDEIRMGLNAMREGREIHLLPNGVKNLNPGRHEVPDRGKRFLLITRPQKLDHIRSAVLFFREALRADRRARLTIAAGMKPRDTGTGGMGGKLDLIDLLGGRWCMSQGPGFLRTLSRIDFIGFVADPRAVMRESDVVMGMGRVIIEGLAEGRLCVLVGYDCVCGPVTARTFDRYRETNFSGRGEPPTTSVKAYEKFVEAVREGKTISNDQLETISMTAIGPQFENTVKLVSDHRERAKGDRELAAHIGDRVLSGSSIARVFARAVDDLSTDELEHLYHFSGG